METLKEPKQKSHIRRNNQRRNRRANPKNKALSIKEALKKYTPEEIHTVWTNLEQKLKGKFDTAPPIEWKDIYVSTDADGNTRYCWGVNRVAYGYGFRDSNRVRVVDLKP